MSFAAPEARIEIDTRRTFPDAFIPALAHVGLDRVPGYRTFPGTDDEDTAWRTDAFGYQEAVIDHREKVHRDAERSKRLQREEDYLCSLDPNYFAAMYGWIEEPRISKLQPAKIIPMVPYHFQVHATNARLATLDEEDYLDLYQAKSRGMGVTWNNLKDIGWYWLYRDSRQLLVSRDQATVYSKGNMGALFTKVVFMLNRLPEWLVDARIPGWSDATHAGWYKKNLLLNKVTGAEIVGTANSDDIARGDRFLSIDIDESQTIRNLEEVVGSAQGASYHLIFTFTESTRVSRENLERWQEAKRHIPAQVLELNHHQNPVMDEEHMAKLEARAMTPEAKMRFRREYYRDPWAGAGEWVYPEARDLLDADKPYDPNRPIRFTLDPAGTGDDVALLCTQDYDAGAVENIHTLWTYQQRLPEPQKMAHLLTGIMPDPGDDAFGQEFDPQEKDIMRFMYQLWLDGARMNFFMDPAGDQNSNGTTYKKMLEKKSGELRQRAVARMKVAQERGDSDIGRIPTPSKISPQCDWLKRPKNRLHGERSFALRRYLPHLTFQRGVLSAEWGRTCLAEARYRPLTAGAVAEPVRLHDQFSHLVSCFEHLSLYKQRGYRDPVTAEQIKVPTVPGKRPLPIGFNRTGPPNRHRATPDRAPVPARTWR